MANTYEYLILSLRSLIENHCTMQFVYFNIIVITNNFKYHLLFCNSLMGTHMIRDGTKTFCQNEPLVDNKGYHVYLLFENRIQ